MKETAVTSRITAAFAATAVFSLAVGIGALYTTNLLANRMERAVRTQARLQGLAGEMNARTSELISLESEIMYRSLIMDAGRATSYREQFQQKQGMLNTVIGEAKDVDGIGAESAAAVDAIRVEFEPLADAHASISQFLDKNTFESAQQQFEQKFLPSGSRLKRRAEQFAATQAMALEQAERASASAVEQSRWVIAALLAASVIAALWGWFLIHGVNRRLRAVAQDLTASAENVAAASAQIAEGGRSLAQGASEQAASIEETSASVHEVESGTRATAESASDMARLMEQASENVCVVKTAIGRMSTAITGVADSSRKVAKIIKIIDEIAFQTNILALNAAVEAARAGDAGLGFAVVADEVRTLAQRSAAAARDTAGLIEESVRWASDSQTALTRVLEAMQSVSSISATGAERSNDVATATREQARRLAAITNAVGNIEQITQRVATGAEESSSASEAMAAQAAELRHMAATLQMLVRSSRGSFTPAATV